MGIGSALNLAGAQASPANGVAALCIELIAGFPGFSFCSRVDFFLPRLSSLVPLWMRPFVAFTKAVRFASIKRAAEGQLPRNERRSVMFGQETDLSPPPPPPRSLLLSLSYRDRDVGGLLGVDEWPHLERALVAAAAAVPVRRRRLMLGGDSRR